MCEEPSQGRKIVERFTDYADVGFVIVLLSPDDYAYDKAESPTKRKFRPRMDVVFELGFLVGRLGAEKYLSSAGNAQILWAPPILKDQNHSFR